MGGCRDKDQFTSKEVALDWMAKYAYANKRTGQIPIRAYYCRHHKAWHVTSKPEGKRNGKR